MTILVASVAAFVFTTVLTMAGVGAAFVLIPILVALGVDIHTAMATALLLNTVAMSVASVSFVRNGLVVWRLVLPMVATAVALSPLGVAISRGLDRTTLLVLFVAFLLLAAGMMLFYKPQARAESSSRAVQAIVGGLVGAVAGFVGGLLGVGGGNIIVPALVALGIDPRKASASASFTVIFASLSGFLSHMSMAHLAPSLLGSTGVATALGALLGSWLVSRKLSGAQLKRVIAVVLIAIAVKMAAFDVRGPARPQPMPSATTDSASGTSR
jgi:uncharacterized membrane protein YfcA